MSKNFVKFAFDKQYPINENMITDDIRHIINDSCSDAVRSVDFCRVQMYWRIGRRIVEEEQAGNPRAAYGTGLIRHLAAQLEPEFGSGFSSRQLHFSRQFYLEYPKLNALRSQFNWTQYRALIQIPDKDKREYYELEAAANNWTAREMERFHNRNTSLRREKRHACQNVASRKQQHHTRLKIPIISTLRSTVDK